MQSSTAKCRDRQSNALEKRKLFSRDLNYLRDIALFWPFVGCSIIAVASAFSPGDRRLALKSAAAAAVVLLLAKEKLFLVCGALGFIAGQCAINLVVRPWDWAIFATGILTGGAFLLANRYWRNPQLAYDFPDKLRAVDVLVSAASIFGSIFLAYFFKRLFFV